MYVCMLCMCVFMYVCMYVCMYAHISGKQHVCLFWGVISQFNTSWIYLCLILMCNTVVWRDLTLQRAPLHATSCFRFGLIAWAFQHQVQALRSGTHLVPVHTTWHSTVRTAKYLQLSPFLQHRDLQCKNQSWATSKRCGLWIFQMMQLIMLQMVSNLGDTTCGNDIYTF